MKRRGEIATTLTIISLVLMALGVFAGSVANKTIKQLKGSAVESCHYTAINEIRDSDTNQVLSNTKGFEWRNSFDESGRFPSAGETKTTWDTDLNDWAKIHPSWIERLQRIKDNKFIYADVELKTIPPDYTVIDSFVDLRYCKGNACADANGEKNIRKVEDIRIECGGAITYGWKVRKTTPPSEQLTPTPQPTDTIARRTTPPAGGSTSTPTPTLTPTPIIFTKPTAPQLRQRQQQEPSLTPTPTRRPAQPPPACNSKCNFNQSRSLTSSCPDGYSCVDECPTGGKTVCPQYQRGVCRKNECPLDQTCVCIKPSPTPTPIPPIAIAGKFKIINRTGLPFQPDDFRNDIWFCRDLNPSLDTCHGSYQTDNNFIRYKSQSNNEFIYEFYFENDPLSYDSPKKIKENKLYYLLAYATEKKDSFFGFSSRTFKTVRAPSHNELIEVIITPQDRLISPTPFPTFTPIPTMTPLPTPTAIPTPTPEPESEIGGQISGKITVTNYNLYRPYKEMYGDDLYLKLVVCSNNSAVYLRDCAPNQIFKQQLIKITDKSISYILKGIDLDRVKYYESFNVFIDVDNLYNSAGQLIRFNGGEQRRFLSTMTTNCPSGEANGHCFISFEKSLIQHADFFAIFPPIDSRATSAVVINLYFDREPIVDSYVKIEICPWKNNNYQCSGEFVFMIPTNGRVKLGNWLNNLFSGRAKIILYPSFYHENGDPINSEKIYSIKNDCNGLWRVSNECEVLLIKGLYAGWISYQIDTSVHNELSPTPISPTSLPGSGRVVGRITFDNNAPLGDYLKAELCTVSIDGAITNCGDKYFDLFKYGSLTDQQYYRFNNVPNGRWAVRVKPEIYDKDGNVVEVMANESTIKAVDCPISGPTPDVCLFDLNSGELALHYNINWLSNIAIKGKLLITNNSYFAINKTDVSVCFGDSYADCSLLSDLSLNSIEYSGNENGQSVYNFALKSIRKLSAMPLRSGKSYQLRGIAYIRNNPVYFQSETPMTTNAPTDNIELKVVIPTSPLPSPIKSEDKSVKQVFLIIHNPKLDSLGGQKLFTAFKEKVRVDPVTLAKSMLPQLNRQGNSVQYELNDKNIVEENTLPPLLDNPDLKAYEENLVACARDTRPDSDGCKFIGKYPVDYQKLFDTYDLCNRINKNENDKDKIDEIFQVNWPFTAVGENDMVGANPYNINGRTQIVEGCRKNVAILGIDITVAPDQALHSFGHRVESTMQYVYGTGRIGDTRENNPNSYSYPVPPRNSWEKFALTDGAGPQYNYSACGNIHSPPTASYWDSNFKTNSICDNFDNYPNIAQTPKAIDCNAWGCSADGFYQWWLDHLPHNPGRGPDGKLNNWWTYVNNPEIARQDSDFEKMKLLDFDNDKTITTLDYNRLTNRIGKEEKTGDINGDNQINAIEVSKLIQLFDRSYETTNRYHTEYGGEIQEYEE